MPHIRDTPISISGSPFLAVVSSLNSRRDTFACSECMQLPDRLDGIASSIYRSRPGMMREIY